MKSIFIIFISMMIIIAVSIYGYAYLAPSQPEARLTPYAKQNIINYVRKTGNPTDSYMHVAKSVVENVLPPNEARVLATDNPTSFQKWYTRIGEPPKITSGTLER